MSTDEKKVAREVVRVLIDDLKKRRGFIDIMLTVRPDVQDEHVATWERIVEGVLRGSR